MILSSDLLNPRILELVVLFGKAKVQLFPVTTQPQLKALFWLDILLIDKPLYSSGPVPDLYPNQ